MSFLVPYVAFYTCLGLSKPSFCICKVTGFPNQGCFRY